MSEARAFGVGYASAIKRLKLFIALQEMSPDGAALATLPGLKAAVQILEDGVEWAGAEFEAWQLFQDPDLQESLGQMRRGEGWEITATFDKP